MADYEYSTKERKQGCKITLDFSINNERIQKDLIQLISNLGSYMGHEWRILCHDSHGNVFDYTFSPSDCEIDLTDYFPMLGSNIFDYATSRIVLNFENDGYLRKFCTTDDVYLHLVGLMSDISSITFTDEEVLFSEWVNG